MDIVSSAGGRRWLLSFLATRAGRRLLRAALTAALALNLVAPVWAGGTGTQGNSGELKRGSYSVLPIPYSGVNNSQYAIGNPPPLQNPKSKIQNPYDSPAVQNALRQLGLDGPEGPENTPVGDQFQVNSYTTNSQVLADVAVDSDGDFVVVWASNGSGGGDTSDFSIQGQRYDSMGVAQGSQFQVNSYTTGKQDFPKVAMDDDGDFVVVWQSVGSSSSDDSYSIQGQQYNSAGTAQGSQFQVNSYTTLWQNYPDVSMDGAGDFVVVWHSYGSNGGDDSGSSIQGQRYNSAGTAQGNEFQVNSYTTNTQWGARVALDEDGDFVVVWQSSGSYGNDNDWASIQGQRYNSVGTVQGGQFQVNSYTTDHQYYAAVAMDHDGDFVVVWSNGYFGGFDQHSIRGQRFNSAGTPQGNEFIANYVTYQPLIVPAVSMDDDGDFVVVWESYYSVLDDSGHSIQGKRYNSSGTAQGDQFLVNSYTTNDQGWPAVALDADGDFVVVWHSLGSNSGTPVDSSSYSIQAQRYLPDVPPPPANQFQVNSYTTGFQSYPVVALDSDGDFVVVWTSDGSDEGDSDSWSIQGQRYNAAGTAQGSQFQVNSYTTDLQRNPAVAMDSDGDFIVVWHSYGSVGNDDSSGSVQGQRYNSAGVAQGGQFQVNAITTGQQEMPGVAMDSSGNFIVVWNSGGIQGQRFDSAGIAQGSQFQISTEAATWRRYPAVAMDSDGDFVVVWHGNGSVGNDNSGDSVQGRRYNSAGTAQGSQFQVNSYTTDNQRYAAVAMDGDGDFVITWRSDGSSESDSSGFSVQAQRYNSAGTAQGSQFQVNSYTTGSQGSPAVSMDEGGDFAIVWTSNGSAGNDNSHNSIQGRVFNQDGLPLLTEFQVNSLTAGQQFYGVVAMDSNGDFVVAWVSYSSVGTDIDSYSIQAARFDLGQLDFQVNTYTTDYQRNPAVAMDGDGDFVIVWHSNGSNEGDTSLNSIQARHYNSNGIALGDQFQVNSYTSNNQRNPAVAMDADGDFVIVWQSYGSAGESSGDSIQGQRYDSAGTAQGSQFLVNTYTTSHQRNPTVTMDSSGNFVVAWESNGSSNGDTAGLSIQQRRFSAAGAPLDPADVRVNSYTTNDQRLPAIAAEANGDFVVVWASNGATGDGSSYSIQGQRYNSAGTAQGSQFQVNSYTSNSQMFPALAMDTDGDFVVAWQSNGASSGDTAGYSIQGQRYTNTGAAAGGQFGVNSYTTGDQLYPAVAVDSDGDFVVVWRSNGSAGGDTSSYSIQGQRYNSSGASVGAQFQVNTYTTNKQDLPAAAVDSDGNLVISWDSLGIESLPIAGGPAADNDYAIVASRFTALGGPEPSAVRLQQSSVAVPVRGGLLAVLAGVGALLTAVWLRLRSRKGVF